MCGIAGYCDFTRNLLDHYEENKRIVEKMGKTLLHRGPDDFNVCVDWHIAFSHARLAVIDVEGGIQPMTKAVENKRFTIIYNGELYNTEEIRSDLKKRGYTFSSNSDTEVLLTAYIADGRECLSYLNGIYSFAIWDSKERCVFLARDRFGVKPLFYKKEKECYLFASEIKALLAYPGVKPKVNAYGLCEIFGLGPARSPGCGVYEGICEIPPAHCAYIDYSGMKLYQYWTLEAKEHTDSYGETVAKVKELLFNAIERQLVSDVPICTLLSGGLDSSLVSAVAANYLKKQGRQLDTYSFDYKDNHTNFKSSAFQPDEDRPFVDIMVNHINSNHHYLECSYEQLYNCLFDAVLAKDLPGMADVDSSMLFFARKIKEQHTVCLSGECADEVFGGYPWFRQKESYEIPMFPWSRNLDIRKMIIKPEVLAELELEEYVACQYEKTMKRVQKRKEESSLEKRQREISYLNISWFMTTLLDRKDRMTMASGLEVRVPFADHRVISYLYNVPWKYKYHNQEVKGLLKDAAKAVLPNEVLYRKKCPYPKTYDPKYENLLKANLIKLLREKEEPINRLVNERVVKELMDGTSDYGKPWFGQLMAVPQMYAYLIEINFWLKEYNIELTI